jgi:hypothetical protein
MKKPYVIFTEDFKSFDELYEYRQMIFNLELVPIKSDEIHKKYHSVNTEDLIKSIDFDKNNILFKKNDYPYLLPNDIEQYLIWIKKDTSDKEVKEFLQEKIKEYKKAITFERSPEITTELVKGSFKYIRHIHFWFKHI